MREFFIKFIQPGAMFGLALFFSCRGNVSEQPPIHPERNMFTQDKGKPMRENNFFSDQRAMRPLVEGTVSTDATDDPTDSYHTGLTTGVHVPLPMAPPRNCPDCVKQNPRPITMELLQQGQKQYQTFCSPCHGALGNGQGSVVQRVIQQGGGWQVPTYHQDEFRNMPDGRYFYVISHGIGTMPKYSNIPEDDRWAIVAYIRALQQSQHATLADLSPEQRSQLP